jgi:hypothetical protein
LTFRRAVFNGDVLTLGITGLIEPLAERGHEVRKPVRRLAMQVTDHWYHGLLRARRPRPSGRSATEHG